VTARRQWVVLAGMVAALGIVLLIANHFIGRELVLVTIGSPAPDFRAETVAARPEPRSFTAGYRGGVVVLNIWATWCPPCRVEMPSLEALQQSFAASGLHVVAVSIDSAGTDSTIQAFVRKYGLTFDILHDPSGRIQDIYQTTGVPETFVIARDGVIRKKVIGADDWASEGNRSLIAQLLKEPRS
jgi:cytochrome c biogenesis protein CcmG, thiol:disulfide interchange protein DsbE